MNTVKILSQLLFYLTRFLSVLYSSMALYSLLVLTTGWCLILHQDNTKFKICYPFTQKPFLLGMYDTSYIAFGFLLPIALYGLFFGVLSNFFKVFTQKKLFTLANYNALRWFYLANLILPVVTIVVASVFIEIEEEAVIMVAFHLLLGVFVYFIAAIFQQGLSLQKEQDLFI